MEKSKNKKMEWTLSQDKAIKEIQAFIKNPDAKVFILTGSAGTGKTTLTKQIIKELKSKKKNYTLLASTGRAAKVVQNATGEACQTVHSLLYTFTGFNQDLEELADKDTLPTDKHGQILLVFEAAPRPWSEENEECFYVVDEASMVSDTPEKNAKQAVFGSGRLLQDLFSFNPKGKYIFIGDICQLPPINSPNSPALTPNYIQTQYHLPVNHAELSEIVRQKDSNDIIIASQKLRTLYKNPPICNWGKFPLKNFKHIKIHPSQADLIQAYIHEIKQNGYDETILITQSNRQSQTLSQLIRPALGINGETIQVNDLLLVTQNNHISGLMNGDMVKVTQTGKEIQKAGLSFRYIEVEELISKKRYSQYIITNILSTQGWTNLNQEQQTHLFIDFFIRMKQIGISPKKHKKEFHNQMLKDPFLNALRAVYGYAVTCHKAQGGEWKEVFLDIPRSLSRQPGSKNYQWLYTAVTRASENLHIADDFYLSAGNSPLNRSYPS